MALHVDDKTRERIKTDKYVDFRSLLPGSPEPEYTLKVDMTAQNPSLQLAPNSQPHHISTFEAWQSSFNIFHFVYIQAHPQLSPQLLKYGDIARELANKFGMPALSYYDRNFRMLREHDPAIPFANVHQELWLRASAFLAPNPRFNQKPRSNSFRPQNNANPARGTCHAYNSPTAFCSDPQCRFAHKCSHCSGSHPWFRCQRARAAPHNSPLIHNLPPTTQPFQPR